MPKFFIDESQIKGGYVEITGQDFKHIANVLRCKIGEELTVSCQNELDYTCKLEKFENDKVILSITDCNGNETEPNLKITLYQALPKSEKMEFIIQKCVEIGVDTIVPIKTDRCIVKLDGKEEKKLLRWNKIAEAAAKQSKRGKVPDIKNVISFKEAIKQSKNLHQSIIPYENEKDNTIKHFCKKIKGDTIGIFIGPEGGFSEDEIKLAVENEVLPMTLGKRILRTETAGMFVSIILLYETEN